MQNSFVHRELAQLCRLLQITYGIAFIGSGIDKFCHILIDWYAQGVPAVLQSSGISITSLLYVRGTIEIIIGLLILTWFVRSGAYAAMIWLLLSAVYMFLVPGHVDTALRYAVIALGAFVLARLVVVCKDLKASEARV